MDTVVNVALTQNEIATMSAVMSKIASAKPNAATVFNWYDGVIPASVKRCATCHIYKDKKAFGRYKLSADGLNSNCRACHAAYRRERYWAKRMELLSSYSAKLDQWQAESVERENQVKQAEITRVERELNQMLVELGFR